MFMVFDSKNDGVIEFGEFVRALSVFHPDASPEEKADCKNTTHTQFLSLHMLFT